MSFDTPEIGAIADAVRAKKPLVHCITNYVTVNDCANALLAVGASPVMADDIDEVADIVNIANALVINIGTLNARTIRSMEEAGRLAASRGIPIILDPVGAGASRLRTETARELAAKIPFTVIRGNLSEIECLSGGIGNTRGVDAACDDGRKDAVAAALAASRALCRATGAVVAVTGAIDVVAEENAHFAISNGHPLMPRITGSGCMLSAILGAFCASASPFEATVAACAAMGLAGEHAAKAAGDRGTGAYRSALIDSLSLMDSRVLAGGMRIERFPR